jgi:2-iminobutanoate/2-iminopropanoate deaminase
MRRREFANESD